MKKTEILVLTICALLATLAFAGIGSVNVGTSEIEVLPGASLRRNIIVQNNSSNDIYLKVDSSTNALTVSNGIKLAAGGGVLTITGDLARNRISARSAVGTNAITFQTE